VYDTVIKYGSEEDWLNMYNLALNQNSNAEKLRFFRALTNTKDLNLLTEFVSFFFSYKLEILFKS
jgi:hypothetical protein